MKKEKDLNYLSYSEAIADALFLSMKKNKDVFIYGQGVDDPKGHYGTTKNFHKIFGKDRCFDTPICEDSMTGIGVGAALAGMRPVLIHQRMDFLMLSMNQIINMASKIPYFSNGKQKVPMVIRACIGRSWGQGAQHSQSLYSFFAHVPGLKVISPTTPYDVKGALIKSINENELVIFVEHRMLYNLKGYVPKKKYEIDFGFSRKIITGSDITLVGVSYTTIDCVNASKILKKKNINAEVIDLISIQPMETEKIIRSVKKTRNLIIVDNDWINCGISAEIISRIVESLEIQIKIKRIGYEPVACPTTRELEQYFYPSPKKIAKLAYNMLTKKTDWNPPSFFQKEIEEFKGPF